MSDRHLPTVGDRMRSRLVPYLVVLTVLWLVVLQVADLLPKEGQMLPRGGTWRPATAADRMRAFVWYTACWYGGALAAFGLVWRMAQAVFDLAFGSERNE
jgi:hypothetical protein